MAKRKESRLLVKLLVYIYKNPFITLGLVLILIFLGWRYHSLRILSFKVDNLNIVNNSGIKPVYIKTYPVGVDIKVEDANIVNSVWQIHNNSANYLSTSANINDNSNIIVYGHNKDDVLGPIRHIGLGAIIEITGSDGKLYKYEVIKTDTVKSDNLSYLEPTDEEILTIYTCVGFLDTERFIVVAKRVDNQINNDNKTTNAQSVGYKVNVGVLKENKVNENIINTNQESINLYITYYGFNDNDPPGRAIAYPKKDGYNSYHNEAGGVGTYQDPISFASSTDLFGVGQIIYVPYIKKYVIMEDFCQTCSKNIANGRKHIDIWAGGDGTRVDELIKCEESYTRELEKVIINPVSNLEVDTKPLCFR